MTRLVPIVDGVRSQFERLPLAEAADRLARAHREGRSWDCRVATSGQGYRLLTPEEAEQLVGAVRERLTGGRP